MMRVIDIIIIAIPAVTVLTHIAIVFGIIRSRIKERKSLRTAKHQPHTLSVIVPARNEEDRLPYLLSSLDKQSDRNFELVLINDRSTDATLDIMNTYAKAHPGTVKIVDLKENTGPGNPKQNALSKGITAACGEVLLFTDADCIVPEHWVKLLSSHFSDPSIGLVFGTVHTKIGTGFLSKYQAFDHVFRYFYTAGSAGMDNPTGGFGNNIAIRAATLHEVGGYDSIGYSMTEDAALIAAVRKKTKYKILALTTIDIKVLAEPKTKWRELTEQEIRWNTGALFAPDFNTRWSYRLVMLYLAIGVCSLFFAPLYPFLALLAGGTFLSMYMVAASAGFLSRMPFVSYWLLSMPNVLVSMVYYLYINVLTLRRVPVSWKGKDLPPMKTD